MWTGLALAWRRWRCVDEAARGRSRRTCLRDRVQRPDSTHRSIVNEEPDFLESRQRTVGVVGVAPRVCSCLVRHSWHRPRRRCSRKESHAYIRAPCWHGCNRPPAGQRSADGASAVRDSRRTARRSARAVRADFRMSRLTLAMPEMAALQSPGVSGFYTVQEALEQLVVGTSLGVRLTAPDVAVIDIQAQSESVQVTANCADRAIAEVSGAAARHRADDRGHSASGDGRAGRDDVERRAAQRARHHAAGR